MAETEQLVAEVPLFKLLDERERGELLRVLESRAIREGEKLFNLGEPGDTLYIVTSGRVELFVKDTTGTKITLMVCHAGDVFGELSLFDGGARTASAYALEDSEVLTLDRPDLLEFVRRTPDAAIDMLAMMSHRIRSADELLRKSAARNINEEMEVRSTLFEKAADVIAEFSGGPVFLLMNVAWFGAWIGWNMIPGLNHFDPYPFGLLTMIVSLEAIFLSIFLLISSNRQTEKDRLRAESDYQVNLRAELEIAHMHEKVDLLTEELLARLPRVARPSTRQGEELPEPRLVR
ncbi:MAG TPA: DUF1003 domain-containing protein [Thermoanaerobaculia bacterium]|nr:DUF1003 domain-containing protein [Thermoanaerobaculia bacterium]